ncbi:hypothetical protein [Acetobacter thailandicus]|uniref:hypothetical protein n=1 Tax=Acetobacter thailandicus TaxID=1502842 RepID=UPI001BA74B88|nr:hypothetical protein [Acetobacter thailandicus]MBS0986629.1 hypothetical protein [Acetobacter thailandicus]
MSGRKAGTPKTGGRQKGTLNKATSEVRSLAQSYGAAVIEKLAHLALNGETEQVQVAACKEILDRGYGKSLAPIAASIRKINSIEDMTDEELEALARYGEDGE